MLGELFVQLGFLLGSHLDGRATCDELLKEYKACESADYIDYVSSVLLFVIMFCFKLTDYVGREVQMGRVHERLWYYLRAIYVKSVLSRYHSIRCLYVYFLQDAQFETSKVIDNFD